MQLSIGIDIGQTVDPTAIVVVQPKAVVAVDPVSGRETKRIHWVGRAVERFPLDLSFAEIAERLVDRVERARAKLLEMAQKAIEPPCPADVRERILRQFGRGPAVYADATGVGAPVVEEIRRALRGRVSKVVSCYISAGHDRVEREGDRVRIGKEYIVSRAQAVFNTGRVSLPNTPEGRALADELRVFRGEITSGGKVKFGAKSGAHDDLVLAFALAIQEDPDPVRIMTPSAIGIR